MSQAKSWVENARNAASQNKKVLAVEGTTDKQVLMPWMEKQLGPTWANSVYVEETRGRAGLLSGLSWLQTNNDPLLASIFGLADRDEWQPHQTAALQAELPRLLVNLQRHSLESYFCDPDELQAILEARDVATSSNAFAAILPGLRQQMLAALPDYVAHWSLCHVVQQANERIRQDAHYPDFFINQCPLPDDAAIRTKLAEWSAIVDANALFAGYTHLKAASLTRPQAEQFRSCIESKLFFTAIVMDGPHGLNRIRAQSKDDWLIELARWSSAMPADLAQTLAPVLT